MHDDEGRGFDYIICGVKDIQVKWLLILPYSLGYNNLSLLLKYVHSASPLKCF